MSLFSRNIFLVIASGLLSVSALSLSHAQVTYPTTTPSGEQPGGWFNTYFKNMYNNPCTNKKAISGFKFVNDYNAGNFVPDCIYPIASGFTGELLGEDGYIPKWSQNGTALVKSVIYQTGSKIGIGTENPHAKFEIVTGPEERWKDDDIRYSHYRGDNTAIDDIMTIYHHTARGTREAPQNIVPGQRLYMQRMTGRVGDQDKSLTEIYSHYRGDGTTVLSDFGIAVSGNKRHFGISSSGNVRIGDNPSNKAPLSVGTAQRNELTPTNDVGGFATNSLLSEPNYGDSFAQIISNKHTDGGGLLVSIGDEANGDEKALALWNSATQKDLFAVTSSGKTYMKGPVGIGTVEPVAKLDVRGTTYTDALGRRAHNRGHLVGSYNSVGANGAQSNPIYTIGSNYNPGTTTLGNMYGIGYSYAPQSSFITGNATGWGMYVAADGDARTFLSSSANAHSYINKNGGNVGIGTDSPAAKLHINSSLDERAFGITSSDLFLNIYEDTDSENWMTIRSDNGSGILFTPRPDVPSVAISSDTGNVGIGTMDPTEKLEVDGNVSIGKYSDGRATDSSQLGYGARLFFNGKTLNSDPLYMARYNKSNDDSELRMVIGDNGNDSRDSFAVGTTDFRGDGDYRYSDAFYPKFTVKANGNVGIGTERPKQKLEVAGHVRVNGGYIEMIKPVTTGGWARGLYYKQTGTGSIGAGLGFYGGGDEIQKIHLGFGGAPWNSSTGIQILKDGNVGIGTSSPSNKLEVAGKVKADLYCGSNTFNGCLSFTSDESLIIGSNFEGDYNEDRMPKGRSNIDIGYSGWGYTGDDNIHIGSAAGRATGGAENVTSNIAIGNHAGYSTSQENTKRNIAIGYRAGGCTIDENSEDNISIGTESGDANGCDNRKYNIFIGKGASAGAHQGHRRNAIAIGYNAEARGSNTIRLGNNEIRYASIQVPWSVTSDKRWKENIRNLPYGLDFVKKLKPVDYFRKNNKIKTREVGFIAQDVEKTLKEIGYKNTGFLTKDNEGYMSLRYNDFIPVLTKAIQEQQEEIESLKEENKKLQSLEERIRILENK